MWLWHVRALISSALSHLGFSELFASAGFCLLPNLGSSQSFFLQIMVQQHALSLLWDANNRNVKNLLVLPPGAWLSVHCLGYYLCSHINIATAVTVFIAFALCFSPHPHPPSVCLPWLTAFYRIPFYFLSAYLSITMLYKIIYLEFTMYIFN